MTALLWSLLTLTLSTAQATSPSAPSALRTTTAASDTVVYEVSFPNAAHHEAEITVTYQNLPAGTLELRMSRSSPGRYALHEFAKNVYSVRAMDGQGRALHLMRPNPHQWDVDGHDGTVRVSYTLFGDRTDGTYAAIDPTHAHLNVPAAFLWARDTWERPIRVTFLPPEGKSWKVATQLAPTTSPLSVVAPNLYYFMDSPIEVSDFDVREWRVTSAGRTHTIRIALHHLGTAAELDSYTDMARRVVREQVAVFGELPDFEHGTYTFIADYLPWASGDGMEHRNSTVLTSASPLSTNALGNLGTLSHEFFHAWNVERIRPRSLEPFDFEQANMSGELWFAEGFTSYYTNLFIRRAGIIDEERYAAGLSGGLNGVINGPGRRYFSPVEMSMQAPFVDAAVSVDPQNRANTFISYYTWGSVLGLGLDLTLRSRFQNLTLDDYMRAMWVRHGTTEVPYTMHDLRTVLGQLVGDIEFANDFFDRYVEGRGVLDYTQLLANAGLLLRKTHPGRATLGQAGISFEGGHAILTTPTLVGSPLYRAGLDRGDRILEIGGKPVTSAAQYDEIVAAHTPGDQVAIRYEQRGEVRAMPITFAEDERLEVLTYEQAGMPLTDAMRAFRASWLGSRAVR